MIHISKFVLVFLLIFLFPLFSEEKKICLVMIVKNEEKIIERCLNSIKDLVDYVSISDTGSSDKTIEKIEQYLKDNRIFGSVHRHEWKNFGINRNLSLEEAKKNLSSLGWSLENTYFLLLDADMLLEIGKDFKKNELFADSYLIEQKNTSQTYYNIRLIKASLPWRCVGVTHEYWSCQQPVNESKLQTLKIDDRDDGGSKSDKFVRDVQLLKKGLEEEPGNSRYMFYLAQSYKCLKDYGEAIKWYQNRIEKGGWTEEVWYAKFMIGQCYEEQGKWDQALAKYLEAYEFMPERAEPLQQISTYYRIHQQHHLAYLFAKKGASIPYPVNHILFVSYPVYEYLFDQDLSISSYYTPFKEEGYAANNRLMLKKNIPQHIKDQSFRNMIFYATPLKNAKFQLIQIELPKIREELAAHYNPMNPSIIRTETGYDVICRTVNYMQIGAKYFKSLDLLDSHNTAKTRNFYLKFDRNFRLLSQREIIEDLPRERQENTNIVGLEDCRMFFFNDATWFTCTTLDTNPSGVPQISLCKLQSNQTVKDIKDIQVEKLIPLFGPDPMRCEKNWLPFVKDGEFFVIYSYDPFVIYKPYISDDNGLITRHLMTRYYVPKYDFSRFSGSASPIEFEGGYLVLIHETVYDDHQRNYLHRFIYMDKKFNIEKVSKPFVFMHKGIEYCCGMTLDHEKENLIMTIGIEDREAYFCSVDVQTVQDLLEPLP